MDPGTNPDDPTLFPDYWEASFCDRFRERVDLRLLWNEADWRDYSRELIECDKSAKTLPQPETYPIFAAVGFVGEVFRVTYLDPALLRDYLKSLLLLPTKEPRVQEPTDV